MAGSIKHYPIQTLIFRPYEPREEIRCASRRVKDSVHLDGHLMYKSILSDARIDELRLIQKVDAGDGHVSNSANSSTTRFTQRC